MSAHFPEIYAVVTRQAKARPDGKKQVPGTKHYVHRMTSTHGTVLRVVVFHPVSLAKPNTSTGIPMAYVNPKNKKHAPTLDCPETNEQACDSPWSDRRVGGELPRNAMFDACISCKLHVEYNTHRRAISSVRNTGKMFRSKRPH